MSRIKRIFSPARLSVAYDEAVKKDLSIFAVDSEVITLVDYIQCVISFLAVLNQCPNYPFASSFKIWVKNAVVFQKTDPVNRTSLIIA